MPVPRKRHSILWSYLIVLAVIALAVTLFALLYRGGGAKVLLIATPTPEPTDSVMALAVTPTPEPQIDRTGRLFPFAQNGQWGYCNAMGQVAIAPQFEACEEFGEREYAFAKQDGLYGMITREGVFAVSPAWSAVRPFSDGYAAVEQDGKWGYIDPAGKSLTGFVYREAGEFGNGRAPVRTGEKWGYIDADGDLAISENWDTAGIFENDMAFAIAGNKQYIIDKTGEKIATMGKLAGTRYANGYAAIRNEDGSYGYYNAKRKRAFKLKLEQAGDFSAEGYAPVRQDGLWGYLNTRGLMVIAPAYHGAGAMCESRAAVMDENGKWGYISSSGGEIADFLYDEAGDFAQGYALVRLGSEYGAVDKTGVYTKLYDA